MFGKEGEGSLDIGIGVLLQRERTNPSAVIKWEEFLFKKNKNA